MLLNSIGHNVYTALRSADLKTKIMIYTKDQNGKIIIAVGAEGSHVRNKDEFNITLPKLIDLLDKNWCRGGLDRHTEPQELFDIMQDDGVPKEKQSNLYNSAYYYFDITRGVAQYNENAALRKADVSGRSELLIALQNIERICDNQNPMHEEIWRIAYEAINSH